MRITTSAEAREFSKTLSAFIQAGNLNDALKVLRSLLHRRTPFRLLDIIGWELGTLGESTLFPLFERVAKLKTEGGWVIIAAALNQRLNSDLLQTLDLAQKYIVQAERWYACDTFGERVIGPALVANFDTALEHLASWRSHENSWVRRSLGVGVHLWTKRTREDEAFRPQRESILDFLEPMVEYGDQNTAKGIGWGLKTLGRYDPHLVHDFIFEQIHSKKRKLPPILIRKAVKLLPDELKSSIRTGRK